MPLMWGLWCWTSHLTLSESVPSWNILLLHCTASDDKFNEAEDFSHGARFTVGIYLANFDFFYYFFWGFGRLLPFLAILLPVLTSFDHVWLTLAMFDHFDNCRPFLTIYFYHFDHLATNVCTHTFLANLSLSTGGVTNVTEQEKYLILGVGAHRYMLIFVPLMVVGLMQKCLTQPSLSLCFPAAVTKTNPRLWRRNFQNKVLDAAGKADDGVATNIFH